VVAGGDLGDVGEMLGRVEHDKPDLICTYRNLNSDAGKWRHSLGDRLDVLTQATPTPVLVFPRPDEREGWGGNAVGAGIGTLRVSVLTDHLTGDDRLISYGVHFTAPGGELLLTHVEDSGVFERYMQVISKIPEIDTERARLTILDQLLKEPREYIESCAQVLEQAEIDRTVLAVVRLGHRLSEYLALIEEEGVGLVVLNTKDDDQLAMHGLAYPLAIELRHVPLLML
jgi:nucleotide-binding universal stress UspA family protein